MTPEYRKALMDVAEMVSMMRNEALYDDDVEAAYVYAYEHVVRKLVEMMEARA